MNQGKVWEYLACRYLEQHGLVLLEKNWRCPYGEIDLIMQDGDILVFVEVKYRRSAKLGSALEQVNHRKQNRIRATAKNYIAKNSTACNCRFDLVAITGTKIEWVKGAFQ